MADITELQTIHPTNFRTTISATTDTQKGIDSVQFTRNPRATSPVMLEGEFEPSAFHRVPSDRPAVQGRITSNSYQTLLGLAGQTASEAQIDCKQKGTSTTITFTLTNVEFEEGSGSIVKNTHGQWTIGFRAASISDA